VQATNGRLSRNLFKDIGGLVAMRGCLTRSRLFSEKDKKSNIENNLDIQRRIYDNKSRSRNNEGGADS
jgi:hypothetical protein